MKLLNLFILALTVSSFVSAGDIKIEKGWITLDVETGDQQD